IYIICGFLIGILLTYILMKTFQENTSVNESHVMVYEIKKLNKMIVAEQVYSDVYSHKNSNYISGFENYFSFDKKVLFLVNAKVQATYDLNRLKVEIDSVNQVIVIQEVPDLKINIYPDVRIYDLEQSKFNQFEKDELNSIKERAVEHIKKTIEREKLEKQAHEQLIENLGNLYLLAKAYGWKIEDRTVYAKELDLKFN